MSTSSSSDRNPVEALADDFLRRQRGGERPTLEDYCRRHPELADEIREVFPVLIRMEVLRSGGPDDSISGVAIPAAVLPRHESESYKPEAPASTCLVSTGMHSLALRARFGLA